MKYFFWLLALILTAVHFDCRGQVSPATNSGVPDSQVFPRLPMERHLTLSPGIGNPRNSEGDFIHLKDGRWLFIYTHFTGGAGDHASACLTSRQSTDEGRIWSGQDEIILANEGGFNIMSVSLLRLQTGEIALFYVRKNSLQDCRPVVRFSHDEAKTWSSPIDCITDEVGYFVLNNGRVIQLSNGSLILPAARHVFVNGKLGPGSIVVYLSDDRGKSWHRSKTGLNQQESSGPISLMEPGVVEVTTNRLLMIIRTKLGCQYLSESSDQGKTWSSPGPSEILSPEAPATLTKIPGTGDLLLICDDHTGRPVEYRRHQPPIRNPLVAAISRDGGVTWEKKKIIEDEPGHGYCYTAVAFDGRRVLLGYCANKSSWGLESTQISSFALDDLYR